MEFDTMVRHASRSFCVIGNNGIWALEKHPMDEHARRRRERRPPTWARQTR